MINEIMNDSLTATESSNNPIFDEKIDYAEISQSYRQSVENWKKLDSVTRGLYKNEIDFHEKNNVIDPKDTSLIPAKNYSLMVNEILERTKKGNEFQSLPIESIDFDESILELAESLENEEEIISLYRLRKKTTGSSKNAGIRSKESSKLKNCFSQGRELYLAGRNGSLMVKPLNFFYALTAYTYGIIVLNNPIRYRKDNIPGSHGMGYLPDAVQSQFGGDSPRGTFSDLVTSFPTHTINTQDVEIVIDCSESLVKYYNIKHSVSLGVLLSMIPEMADYYKLTSGLQSRCYPIEISTTPTARSLTWEFHIGDGKTRPSIESIHESFPGFDTDDRYGKIIVSIPASQASHIKACIYTDIRGKLWYIENPFYPVILPEIAVHFLATSMFSNIMRYKPEEWGSVLLNEVPSRISLLTRHYFSSFQRKFFVIVLRCLSRYYPYAS